MVFVLGFTFYKSFPYAAQLSAYNSRIIENALSDMINKVTDKQQNSFLFIKKGRCLHRPLSVSQKVISLPQIHHPENES